MKIPYGIPPSLALVIGGIMLARELISLTHQIQRLKRKDYDYNRRDFRHDYHPDERSAPYEAKKRGFGRTYEHED